MGKGNLRDLPVLKTEKLLLRTLAVNDADEIFEYASDPEVTKYTIWKVHHCVEDTRKFVSWLIHGRLACWALVHKGHQKVIGICFLHSFDWHHKKAEIAFNLSRKYWSQGYTTEAAREIVLFAFRRWGLNRIEGACMIKNRASARVLEKIGMRFFGLSVQHEHKMKLYAIRKDEIRLGSR